MREEIASGKTTNINQHAKMMGKAPSLLYVIHRTYALSSDAEAVAVWNEWAKLAGQPSVRYEAKPATAKPATAKPRFKTSAHVLTWTVSRVCQDAYKTIKTIVDTDDFTTVKKLAKQYARNRWVRFYNHTNKKFVTAAQILSAAV
jgi:hypothetical protein